MILESRVNLFDKEEFALAALASMNYRGALVSVNMGPYAKRAADVALIASPRSPGLLRKVGARSASVCPCFSNQVPGPRDRPPCGDLVRGR